MAGIALASGFNRTSANPLDLYATVADNTARDAIASGVRYEGMVVYSIASAANYQLIGGILNANWSALPTTSFVRSINSVSTNTTMGASSGTDYVYLVSGTTTMTLPTAVSNKNRYAVNNSGTATVTLNTTSSQTINGSTSITIDPNNTIEVISNNANWQVI